MEVIKVFDEYIELLNAAPSLGKDDLGALIEEISRVVFSPDELKTLVLDYYFDEDSDLQTDAKKLKAKLSYERALLIDANEKAERQTQVEHEKNELEKMRLQAELSKGSISINNVNHNENTNTVNASFESARQRVSGMTSLPEEELQDVLNKIDALEAIVKSDVSKTSKWSRAKEIIRWIADKGVDVGIAILPLLLQIT